jgi:two-component system, OmpR family, copper resistance phosphate regulon response regulator CusR
MRVLIVEDDKITAQTLRDELADRFVVELSYTGIEGEFKAQVNRYDLIILDYTLPDINGIDICRKLRDAEITSPVLMLTGNYEIANKVDALNSGVDDYLTKPFNIEELYARINALLRRSNQTFKSEFLTLADLKLDLSRRLVIREGKIIRLRRKEIYLLEYLMRNAGRVVTRAMILDHVWDSATEYDTNFIDVHITNLRNQIDKPFHKKLIVTVHGIGYKMEAT